ncbi:PREDICTED: uncharacterized protein LOC106115587 [Papilio xuthus]|uniref:Uncharacterized protein LOC106115587 n=1 Tax=Papilio xuthus TaxID=66420 RepID=A0AAJ6Z368_PAPXU|nr:PREDICTED: uncharacterized protein LOC106115587 [Papilio xuthus]
MITCVFCKTQYEKGSGISLHKFPKGGALKRWLNNMKLDNFIPTDNDRLCSKHFTAECFSKHKTRTTLNRSSIPTIFDSKMKLTSSASSQKEDSMKDGDTRKSCKAQRSKNKRLQKLKSQGANTTSNPIEDPLDEFGLRRPIKIEIEEKLNTSCSCLMTNCNANQDGIPVKGISHVWGTVKHDHCYQTDNPTLSKKAKEELQNNLKIARYRIKVLSQHVKRLRNKITSLKDTNKQLRKRKVIGDAFVDMLKDGDDVKPQLFKRMFLNADKNVSHAGYPKELKSFSITLYALSPQAYAYVRKKFNLALPHPRMIRAWRSALNQKSEHPVENINSVNANNPAGTSGEDGLKHTIMIRTADSPYEFNSVQDGMEHVNSDTETPCILALVQDEMEHVNSGNESPSESALPEDEMEHVNTANESPSESALPEDEMEHVNGDNETPCEITLIEDGMEDGMEDEYGAIELPYRFTLIRNEREHVDNDTEMPCKFTLVQNGMERVNATNKRKKTTKQKNKKKNDLNFKVGTRKPTTSRKPRRRAWD